MFNPANFYAGLHIRPPDQNTSTEKKEKLERRLRNDRHVLQPCRSPRPRPSPGTTAVSNCWLRGSVMKRYLNPILLKWGSSKHFTSTKEGRGGSAVRTFRGWWFPPETPPAIVSPSSKKTRASPESPGDLRAIVVSVPLEGSVPKSRSCNAEQDGQVGRRGRGVLV